MKFVTENNIRKFLEELSNTEEMWKGLKHDKTSVNVYLQNDFYDYSPYYYYNVYVYMYNEQTEDYDRYLLVVDDKSCSIQKFNEEVERYRPIEDAKFKWISFMIKNSEKDYSKEISNYSKKVIESTSNNCKKQINELMNDYQSLKQITQERSLNVKLPTADELASFKVETEQQIKELVNARNEKLKPYFEINKQANTVINKKAVKFEM